MKQVLIVDDQADNLYLLRALLTGHGYLVEEAANGSEALVKALAVKPDMVISDILMPVIDGFTLCRIFKADDRLKEIPFIFYTATYTDPRDEELALDLGADAFVIKPTEPDEFLKRIEDVLAADRSGKLKAPRRPAPPEGIVLKEYNEALVRKLEQKMLKLEQANKALADEISVRKRAEDEIQRLNDDLEQKVQKRTAELRKTIGQLEELNRVFVGRELKMAELKARIAELEKS